MCEPIFAKPIKDISFGRLLLHLFQTARRFNMEVQPQLVLLQKTLFNIEGLGRRLYPELDLWETAKPFLEQWTREHLGPRALLRTLRRELPKWWEIAPQFPGVAHEVLARARDGKLELGWRSRELQQLRAEMGANQRRLYFAVMGSAFIVSGALTLGVNAYAPLGWEVMPLVGWVLGALGLVLLIRAWPR